MRCPEGHESTSWGEYQDKVTGRPSIRAGFSPADCWPCPARSRCTRAASRRLNLRPRAEHEAITAARARQAGEAGRRLYAQRQGVEGTISQGVRAFGLRRARYRGLAKTSLQSVATAAALNLDRLAAWLAGRPLAPTRTSRFAAQRRLPVSVRFGRDSATTPDTAPPMPILHRKRHTAARLVSDVIGARMVRRMGGGAPSRLRRPWKQVRSKARRVTRLHSRPGGRYVRVASTLRPGAPPPAGTTRRRRQ